MTIRPLFTIVLLAAVPLLFSGCGERKNTASATNLRVGESQASDPGGIPVTAQAPVSFNRDIRPILSNNCIFCHGPDPKHRGGEPASGSTG